MKIYIEEDFLFCEGPTGKKEWICTIRKNGLPCDYREGLGSGESKIRETAEYLNVSEAELSTVVALLRVLDKNRAEANSSEISEFYAENKNNKFNWRRFISKRFM